MENVNKFSKRKLFERDGEGIEWASGNGPDVSLAASVTVYVWVSWQSLLEATMAGTTINPYRFGGQLGYRKDSPDRLYIRKRHIDTSRGRWLSRDPFLSAFNGINTDSNSFNLYWYAKNRPTFAVDPSGLQDFPGGGFPSPISFPPNPILPPNFPNPITVCRDIAKCTACSLAILGSYIYQSGSVPPHYTWQHACDHLYAHCMACCVLTRYVNSTCAWSAQWAEIKGKPIKGGNNSGRIQGCSAGVAVAANLGTCDANCQAVFSFTTGPTSISKPPTNGLPDASGHTCGSHAKTRNPGFGPLALCGGTR